MSVYNDHPGIPGYRATIADLQDPGRDPNTHYALYVMTPTTNGLLFQMKHKQIGQWHWNAEGVAERVEMEEEGE